MSNIEVGEYVRDEEGNITKIENVINGNLYIGDDGNSYPQKCILKHSKNIIDLIEVGDYINGFRVDKIVENLDDNRNSFVICNEYIGEKQRFKQHAIQNIVTKEQFNEMGYNVYE